MAIQIPSLDDLNSQALAFFRIAFPSRDLGTESFLGKESRALALLVLSLQKAVLEADNDSVPTTKTSSDGLDAWAEAIGLPNGETGKYGRKVGEAATGGVALATGTLGTVWDTSTEFALLASDGITRFEIASTANIGGSAPGTGTTSVTINAITKGTVGNLAVDEVLTWESPPSGASGTVTLTTALSGGKDSENNSDLLDRILARLQSPPRGGTASDYKSWAESVTGAYRAYVYPLRRGVGTVDTVVLQSGTGLARTSTTSIVTDVTNYIEGTAAIEGKRPVTANSQSALIAFTSTSGLAIRLRMVPSSGKFNFDWDLGTTTFRVSTYTAPTGSVAAFLIMRDSLPATLKAAIDAGDEPRLQINTTSTPVPVMVRTTAYTTGASVDKLVLENPLPTGFTSNVPALLDPCYPGGPMVTKIATAVLSYVDGLGPSRAGGYADTYNVWEDKVAIARLIQIALDQLDNDGITRMASNIIASGVTVNGSATDVQADDDTTNNPELLYAKSILVTD